MNKINHNILHYIIVSVFALIKSSLFASVGVAVIVVGYILIIVTTGKGELFYTIVFGLPLIFAGLSVFIINFFSFIEATINSKVNQARCPFCNREKIS